MADGSARTHRREVMSAPKTARAMNFDRIKIFSGNANPPLVDEVCRDLGCGIGFLNRFGRGASQVRGTPRVGDRSDVDSTFVLHARARVVADGGNSAPQG